MSDQVYCSFNDVLNDLEQLGFSDESGALDKLRAASGFIERRIGSFIPITKTINLDGDGLVHLFVPPLLSITSITNDGTTLVAADYILYPRDKHWEDGPYTRISVDPDASNLSAWKRERDAIAIVGSWGKYSKTQPTGATVRDTTEQDASQTTLLVEDGSLISPGDTLLIESEQELVTGFSGTGTDSGKNLNANADTNDDVLTLETGHGLLAGEIIRINNEQMQVVRPEGTTSVIVRRGWNGTTRAAHTSADDVWVYRTFVVERGVNGTTGATHAQTTAIARYRAPGLVKYLAVQIAVLMIKKAQTGFAGKVANIEVGEIFYHDEFPDSVWKEVKTTYRC
jgi:hypothetical protein